MDVTVVVIQPCFTSAVLDTPAVVITDILLQHHSMCYERLAETDSVVNDILVVP